MDGVVKLAQMLKERENVPYKGPQIGTVASVEPIKVALGNAIILDSSHLVIAAHVLSNYQRAIEIPSTSELSGSTTVAGEDSHSHSYDSLGLTGTITLTDGLAIGDQVILIPSTDEQKYFLIDKVVNI